MTPLVGEPRACPTQAFHRPGGRLPEGQRSVPPGPTGTPACPAPQPGPRCPRSDLNGSTARRGAGNSVFVFTPR